MLRKHSRLLFLVTPLLLPVASHAQSSPELTLILDRLERLETENRNLAAEVRALAQRSANAAQDVRGLIMASVEQVADSTRQMDEANETIGRTVGEVMTHNVVTADEDTPVHVLASRMMRYSVNRLPVVRAGQVVGIVTRADVLKVFMRSDELLEREAPLPG